MPNLLTPPNVKRSPLAPEPPPPSPPADGTEWRCPACQKDLFGKWKGGALHIKYQDRSLLVQGVIKVTCRKCGNEASIDTRRVRVNLVQSLGDLLPDEFNVNIKFDATQAARKLAEKLGIDLGQVKGTGKDGRIIQRDVEMAAQAT